MKDRQNLRVERRGEGNLIILRVVPNTRDLLFYSDKNKQFKKTNSFFIATSKDGVETDSEFEAKSN